LGNDFGSDAAADVNAARGQNFQREVGSFRAVIIYKQIQCLYAEIGFAFERGAGDNARRFFAAQFGGEPFGFSAAPGIAEKFVDVELAGAGKDGFPIDLAKAFPEIVQQFDVQVGARSKIRVAAFRGYRQVAIAVPEKTGFAQARAGGNDGGVADGAFLAFVERDEVGGSETVNAVGVGLEVVDEPGM